VLRSAADRPSKCSISSEKFVGGRKWKEPLRKARISRAMLVRHQHSGSFSNGFHATSARRNCSRVT
jgi:hypothetical protein